MISAIGNAPAPMSAAMVNLKRCEDAPAPEPTPVPEPTEGGGDGKNLAFKGIIFKNVPGKTPISDYFDYIYSAAPVKSIRNGISRKDLANRSDNVFLMHFNKDMHLLRGKTKAIEQEAYKDLAKNKEMIPGLEVHLVDDWA